MLAPGARLAGPRARRRRAADRAVEGGATDALGIVFALLAGTWWGLYNLLTQRVGDRFSGITGLAFTIPIAAVVTTIIGLPQVIGGTPSVLPCGTRQ